MSILQKEVKMLTINLDRQEVQLISQLLTSSLEDLRQEIRHTDRQQYKEGLRENERILNGLILKLEELTLGEEIQFEMS
jgi:hypothetical protein